MTSPSSATPDEDTHVAECPYCREVNKYYPFPVGISVFGFLLVMFIVILVYFQYFMLNKRNVTCLRLLDRHHA